MWTYKESKPIADKLNARIVGSVKTKGSSNHDLDLLVKDYTPNVEEFLKSIGYEFVGSQVVSPQEIRKSRKFGKNSTSWLRNRRFENSKIKKVIEIWSSETDDEIIKENMEKFIPPSEPPSTEGYFWWLSPVGNFYSAQYMNHSVWATNYIVNDLHMNPYGSHNKTAYSFLYEWGWIRVGIVQLYHRNDELAIEYSYGKQPSQRLIKLIRDLGVEKKAKWIIDGNTKREDRIDESIKKSQLKYLIKEILTEWRGSTSGEWIEPNGTPHDVGSNSHYDWAEGYLKVHGPNRFKDDPREELVSRGWAQVVYSYHDSLIMLTVYHRGNSYLTRQQKEYLQDQSEETCWKVMDDNGRDIYIPDDCKTPTDRNLQNEKCDVNRISNNQVYTGKTSFGGYGHGATNDYSDVQWVRDPLNDPMLTGKKPFKETVDGRVIHESGYTFEMFSELAKSDGFGYPIDVKRGTIYLGTLKTMPDGFIVSIIGSPSGPVSYGEDMPAYKSMLKAAKVLHQIWVTYRKN